MCTPKIKINVNSSTTVIDPKLVKVELIIETEEDLSLAEQNLIRFCISDILNDEDYVFAKTLVKLGVQLE